MKAEALTFDPGILTAAQMIDLLSAEASGDMDTVAEYLAMACVSCPRAWGKHDDPATFAKMKVPLYKQTERIWIESCEAIDAESKTDLPDGVTLDLENVLYADVMKLRACVTTGDVDGAAAVLARVISTCPWGDATNYETYLALSYFKEFMPLQKAVLIEASDGQKKESKPSRSISRVRRG